MTHRTLPIARLLVVALLACALVAVAAIPAPASFAPRSCGTTSVRGKRYEIKADITCSRAKRWARAYLAHRTRPRGWTCRNFTFEIKFRCTNRGQTRSFFAIKR